MEKKLDIVRLVAKYLRQFEKKNLLFLLYYSLIESILLSVAPLTSAFIINSVLAHATVSIYALSVIVIVIFSLIAFLQVVKEVMIEKFEQKIFVVNAIEIAKKAAKIEDMDAERIDKYMNYFFDVVSLQKLFPSLFLGGFSLVTKVVVSLVLLLFFDVAFFVLGVVFMLIFIAVVLFIGRQGPMRAIKRSDAKHEAIYFIQSIPFGKKDGVFKKLDEVLMRFVHARMGLFRIVVRQLALTYFIEGFILAIFFIVGGYLVFEGMVPIGEFVATEIIVLMVVNALKDFMKQIDYIYEMIEGLYKVDKLARELR